MAEGEAELYSAWFCPFAQRAWIAAEEKGIKYKLIEVDPYAKPPELMAVNPRGLVPGFRHAGQSVFESMVVMEYIDEAFKGPDLMPKDAYKRAVGRIWMDYINRKIVPTFYRYLQRQDKAEQETEKQHLLDSIKEFAEGMIQQGGPEGPFFFGKDFSLVDICVFPWAARLDILEAYRGFQLPEGEAYRRFASWLEACSARPGVRATLADKDRLMGTYKRYADNTATSEVAKAINKDTPLP